jgi:hypothetical protein
MKISKTSWHYRWMEKCWNFSHSYESFEPPTSLCAYFWRFVLSNLYAAFIICVGTVIVLWIPVSSWSYLRNHSSSAAMFFWIWVVGVVFFASLVGIRALRDYFRHKLDEVTKGKPATFTQVTLGTIVATKQKFCPTIDYDP